MNGKTIRVKNTQQKLKSKNAFQRSPQANKCVLHHTANVFNLCDTINVMSYLKVILWDRETVRTQGLSKVTYVSVRENTNFFTR